MFAPVGRDNDWVFTTRSGYKLLRERYFNISRLFVISNKVQDDIKDRYSLLEATGSQTEEAEVVVSGLLTKFLPLSLRYPDSRIPFMHPSIRYPGYIGPFIYFDDGLLFRVNVMNSTEPCHALGDFVIQDEVKRINGELVVNRKVRFQKTSDWVHMECIAVGLDRKSGKRMAIEDSISNSDAVKFKIHTRFVDPHGNAMLYGYRPLYVFLSRQGKKHVMCFGATTGLLAKELETMGCIIALAEADIGVLNAVRSCFDVNESSSFHISPINIIEQDMHTPDSKVGQRLAEFRSKGHCEFDVIVVDLKDHEPSSVSGACAPPRYMATLNMLNKMKLMIREDGALVMNVIPPDYMFCSSVLTNLKEVFSKVYRVNVSEKNFVVIASKSATIGSTSTSDAAVKDKGVLKSFRGLVGHASKEDAEKLLKSFTVQEI